MIDSPTPAIVADADMLSPYFAAMRDGIDLRPSVPRTKALIVDGYREILEVARYLKNDAEVATILSRLADLGVEP